MMDLYQSVGESYRAKVERDLKFLFRSGYYTDYLKIQL